MAGYCPERQSGPRSQANAGPIWVMIFAKSARLASVLRLLGASFYSSWRGLGPPASPATDQPDLHARDLGDRNYRNPSISADISRQARGRL
jgi:hypothetical protein